MDEVRIVLAARPRLFRDALCDSLAKAGGLLVERVGPGNLDILLGARRSRPDVVIATFASRPGIPPLVTHLVAEFPDLLVVGIFLDEGCARLYRHGRPGQLLAGDTLPRIIEAIVESASPPNETVAD